MESTCRRAVATCLRRTFLLATLFYPIIIANAEANCDLDPACYVGKSAAKGASEEVKNAIIDAVRTLIPEIMGQFEGTIRNGILSLEDAEKRVLQIVDKMAHDAIADAKLRGDELLANARTKALEVEKETMKDLDGLMKTQWGEAYCLARVGALLLDEVESKLKKDTNDAISRFNPLPESVQTWWKETGEERQCRSEWGIDLPLTDLGSASTFHMWRCLRLKMLNKDSRPSVIADAYSEIAERSARLYCASRGQSEDDRNNKLADWSDASWRLGVWTRAKNSD